MKEEIDKYIEGIVKTDFEEDIKNNIIEIYSKYNDKVNVLKDDIRKASVYISELCWGINNTKEKITKIKNTLVTDDIEIIEALGIKVQPCIRPKLSSLLILQKELEKQHDIIYRKRYKLKEEITNIIADDYNRAYEILRILRMIHVDKPTVEYNQKAIDHVRKPVKRLLEGKCREKEYLKIKIVRKYMYHRGTSYNTKDGSHYNIDPKTAISEITVELGDVFNV